jgi:hypothetical protein
MALGDHLYDYAIQELQNFPGNYLEIGVFNGDGFARIADAYPNKKCYAIDPFIEDGHTSPSSDVAQGNKLSNQKENFINYTQNLSNTSLFEQTSAHFFSNLTDLLIDEMEISIVVIDGSHHYNDVTVDCQLSLKLLGKLKKGIIIFDDLHISDVRRAYEEFLVKNKDAVENTGLFGNNAAFVKIQL